MSRMQPNDDGLQGRNQWSVQGSIPSMHNGHIRRNTFDSMNFLGMYQSLVQAFLSHVFIRWNNGSIASTSRRNQWTMNSIAYSKALTNTGLRDISETDCTARRTASSHCLTRSRERRNSEHPLRDLQSEQGPNLSHVVRRSQDQWRPQSRNSSKW